MGVCTVQHFFYIETLYLPKYRVWIKYYCLGDYKYNIWINYCCVYNHPFSSTLCTMNLQLTLRNRLIYFTGSCWQTAVVICSTHKLIIVLFYSSWRNTNVINMQVMLIDIIFHCWRTAARTNTTKNATTISEFIRHVHSVRIICVDNYYEVHSKSKFRFTVTNYLILNICDNGLVIWFSNSEEHSICGWGNIIRIPRRRIMVKGKGKYAPVL